MGLNVNAEFEYFIKKKSYKQYENYSLLMLGKQDVNFSVKKVYECIRRVGFEYKKGIIDLEDIDVYSKSIDSYDLFKLLGFRSVYALDINDYEGANIIADLADIHLTSRITEKFDYILDGGTLEHIFDIKEALINTCKLLRENGVIIHNVPSNGWCDHGFYSFSPSFFIDFYKNNGFDIDSIFLFGYKYPDTDAPAIFSPDCRMIDVDRWVKENGKEFRFNVICIARKVKSLEKYNLHFLQHMYEDYFCNLRMMKERYDFEYRMNKLLEKINDKNRTKRISIYGSGQTAERIIELLGEKRQEIIGVYELNKKVGDNVRLGVYELKVLCIDDVIDDNIGYIFIASVKRQVIDIIRQRIREVKYRGIELI
ncbi:hypothetical protein SAMN05216390_108110 [Lachnospiraceae bacterium KH1T2]|nr:hypothetical protein SAMN05216390_108110 [Lachnospiraceae bacterium KH1T2]